MKIHRRALVDRHAPESTEASPDPLLQVGNGEFAFGFDATGLQSLAGNTMAQWGWHTAPLPPGLKLEDFRHEMYDHGGRTVSYATSSEGQKELFTWLRENPHRLNLGRIRLCLDGRAIRPEQLGSPVQRLDLWSGMARSRYTLDGISVTVETGAHPDRDAVGFRIESDLLQNGRLTVELDFPYGSPGVDGADWGKDGAHDTRFERAGAREGILHRCLDDERYSVAFVWSHGDLQTTRSRHRFLLMPEVGTRSMEGICHFRFRDESSIPSMDFEDLARASTRHWEHFWTTGGAVDLSESRDPRWRELERRIVLSQYHMAVNGAGSLPPQESGLYNSSGWYGKFHLEMHWWHGTHFALWDRWSLFEKSFSWYERMLPVAHSLAQSQGFKGARWPKMVGPDGRDAPSYCGPLLAWQQPHVIFYALLAWRRDPSLATLRAWQDRVFATADFMASYAVRDDLGVYHLAAPLKTVPENTDPRHTEDPAFELSYWRFGLRIAIQWRLELGLPPEPKWQEVLWNLAPLPEDRGLYLQQRGMVDTFTQMNWEHPSLVGPGGMLPGDGVDGAVMKATIRKVFADWQWDRCWGWDFPMMAMAAARSGEPDMAVEALLHPSHKNGFDRFGFSTGGPYPYFPSNGGLLYAIALMCAGWDGAPVDDNAPGFPKDGSWKARWEGLHRAP